MSDNDTKTMIVRISNGIDEDADVGISEYERVEVTGSPEALKKVQEALDCVHNHYCADCSNDN